MWCCAVDFALCTHTDVLSHTCAQTIATEALRAPSLLPGLVACLTDVISSTGLIDENALLDVLTGLCVVLRAIPSAPIAGAAQLADALTVSLVIMISGRLVRWYFKS